MIFIYCFYYSKADPRNFVSVFQKEYYFLVFATYFIDIPILFVWWVGWFTRSEMEYLKLKEFSLWTYRWATSTKISDFYRFSIAINKIEVFIRNFKMLFFKCTWKFFFNYLCHVSLFVTDKFWNGSIEFGETSTAKKLTI